jgi:hypothetical protein
VHWEQQTTQHLGLYRHLRFVGQQGAVISWKAQGACGVCVTHVDDAVGDDCRNANALYNQHYDGVPAAAATAAAAGGRGSKGR